MKFSKNLFLSAAILLGGACMASAAITVDRDRTVTVNKQLTEDYYVTENGTLTLNITESHTMSGHFYGSSSGASHGATPGSLGHDYADNNIGYYDINDDGGKIEISGGGILEYQGFKDINYYSSTYLITHNEKRGVYEQAYTESLVGIDENGNVDVDKTAFSGQLTVSGGTKLVVSGYLSQYVSYNRPRDFFSVASNVRPQPDSLGFVGVSNLVLSDTSVLSFASAEKNLLSMGFDLQDGDAGAPEGAVGVRALNFLLNVKADINSTIELGTDKASTSRIVIGTTDATTGQNFDWDGESVIGKLSGTGRIYFVDASGGNGDCSVSITNRAEFFTLSEGATAESTLDLNTSSESSVLNYVHNLAATYDLTGNTYVTTDEGKELVTGVLADVYLLTDANIGSDSTGTYVVNNVLETATAVQLSAEFSDSNEEAQVSGASWEARGRYVNSGSMLTAETVNIYGTQIFNNFQSLANERYTLYKEYSDGGEGYYELTPFYTENTRWNYGASQANVFIRSGGTLIINQQENRDGLFTGRFFASDITDIATAELNDAYIIKTGEGTFLNTSSSLREDSSGLINRLFVYEGQWVTEPEALGSGRVYVGNGGTLRILSNYNATLEARLEGSGLSDLIFSYDTSWIDEDGEWHGGYVNDGREGVYDEESGRMLINPGEDLEAEEGVKENWNPYRGNVQVAAAQNNFYGTVTVNDGMGLTLGKYGDNELDSVFSNASSIQLVTVSDHPITGKTQSAYLDIASYQILPTLIGGDGTELRFSDNAGYDSVAVLTGASEFTGKITGNGSLVKAGVRGLSLKTSAHTLSTVALTGTLAVEEESGLVNSSGIVLANASRLSAASGKSQSLSALVGSADATVALSGGANLTVGLSDSDLSRIVGGIQDYYNAGWGKIQNDGYFFATADADAYLGSFGLNLGSVGGFTGSKASETIASLGAIRPDYMREDTTGALSRETITVQDTINYLKDPAKLANTFAHIYATIDTGTFDAIQQSSIWSGLGITETRLDSAFNRILDLKTIREFVASAPADWTERQLNDLLTCAENYKSDPASVFVYESTTGAATLTRASYQNLLDSNVIKYIAGQGSGLTAEQVAQAETFYGFISLFVDDYKFRLTEENLNTLSKLYGFDVSSIRAAQTDDAKYAEFEKRIGIQYADGELPAFAGVISGEGTELKKIGSETLRLTGQNTYTGATIVQGGELRVDWDAIRKTSGVYVNAGALLTLVSEDVSDCVFKIASDGVISGAGTILKDGEGTLVIESALGKADGADFTGEIVVGKGGLIINAGERSAFAETVNVYLNEGTTFGLNVDAEKVLTFNGAVLGGAPSEVDGTEVTARLIKRGDGKLVFTQGSTLANAENEYDFVVEAGEMELVFDRDTNFRGNDSNFSAVLGSEKSEATLTFNVAEGTTTTFAGSVTEENSAATTCFRKIGEGALVLSALNGEWTVDKLSLDAGTITVAQGAAYSFEQIVSLSGTAFNVNGALLLSGTADDKNVFGGSLGGTGTIEIVNGELELSEIPFSGLIKLGEKSELKIDIGTDETLNFNLTSVAGTKLTKLGAGAATIAGTFDWNGVSVAVEAGTLALSGAKLSDNNPEALAVSAGATLKIDPAKDGFDLANLKNGLSGAGTLSLGAGKTTVSSVEAIKNFTGTFEVGTGAEIDFGAGIDEIGGIAGEGTVSFDNAETTITLAPNRDAVFTGTLDTAENVKLIVAGSGVLTLSDGTTDATLAAGTSIEVGAGTQAGALAVSLANTADVALMTNGSALELVGDVAGKTYGGKLTIAENVSEIGIGLEGEIALSKEAFGKLFANVEGATDNLTVTLANRNNGSLTLNLVGDNWTGAILTQSATDILKPYDFSNEGIVLATNAGGMLELATSSAVYSYALYTKDIGGAGGLKKSGDGELRLTSATQSYTGATVVEQGTLTFASGTQLATSALTVKAGATLSGGVTLTAENASVDFEDGAKYRLNISAGEALRYKGNVSIEGQVILDIATDQSARGEALSIFEYVGSDTENVNAIDKNSFSIASSGEALYIDVAALEKGNLKVYVAQDDFRKTGAELHDGVDGLVDLLNKWATPENGYLNANLSSEEVAIADALNKTSLDDLGDAITNLSPLAYASMISMPHAGFSADMRAVSSRLEQRLYDSNSAIWVYERDVEFFAQAQGSTVDGGSDSDSMVYDYNTYGALAGMDIKFNKETTAGVAVAYDHGKADIHANGGEIESDNIRATFFVGHLINDYLSLNAGAQIGYASYDIERNTLLGKNKGDTDGWHGGVFADLVGACTIHEWGENAHLDFFPHAGLSLSYYRVDKFEESSSRNDWGSSLATDAFDAISLQARLGAAVNCVFEIGEYATRVGLDVSLIHEFLDDEVEIESCLVDSEFDTDARAISGTSLSVAPSASFDLNERTSIYLNYEFRIGTESEVAHRANLGYRYRF